MSKKKNNTYSEEFKQEAVRLALESGKPKSQVARELGIATSILYSWINRYDEAKSQGLSPKELTDKQAELRRLHAENKRLKEENDILKKAAAYFAKNQK